MKNETKSDRDVLKGALLRNMLGRNEWEAVDDCPQWIEDLAEKLLDCGWVRL